MKAGTIRVGPETVVLEEGQTSQTGALADGTPIAVASIAGAVTLRLGSTQTALTRAAQGCAKYVCAKCDATYYPFPLFTFAEYLLLASTTDPMRDALLGTGAPLRVYAARAATFMFLVGREARFIDSALARATYVVAVRGGEAVLYACDEGYREYALDKTAKGYAFPGRFEIPSEAAQAAGPSASRTPAPAAAPGPSTGTLPVWLLLGLVAAAAIAYAATRRTRRRRRG